MKKDTKRRILGLVVKVAILVTVMVVALRWNPDAPKTDKLALPSGKHVETFERTRINFTGGNSALVLKYWTKIDFADHDALRREADEIWPSFRGEVENAGSTQGILSANHTRWFSKKVDVYQFIYAKQADGTWKLMDEGKVSL